MIVGVRRALAGLAVGLVVSLGAAPAVSAFAETPTPTPATVAASPTSEVTPTSGSDSTEAPDVAPDNNTPPPAVPDIGRTGEVGFPLRSAVVDSDGAKDLAKVIDYLKARPKATLELEGRADKREPAKLAADRAKNVRSFLVGLGISGERLIIKPSRTRKQESSVEWRIVER